MGIPCPLKSTVLGPTPVGEGCRWTINVLWSLFVAFWLPEFVDWDDFDELTLIVNGKVWVRVCPPLADLLFDVPIKWILTGDPLDDVDLAGTGVVGVWPPLFGNHTSWLPRKTILPPVKFCWEFCAIIRWRNEEKSARKYFFQRRIFKDACFQVAQPPAPWGKQPHSWALLKTLPQTLEYQRDQCRLLSVHYATTLYICFITMLKILNCDELFSLTNETFLLYKNIVIYWSSSICLLLCQLY